MFPCIIPVAFGRVFAFAPFTWSGVGDPYRNDLHMSGANLQRRIDGGVRKNGRGGGVIQRYIMRVGKNMCFVLPGKPNMIYISHIFGVNGQRSIATCTRSGYADSLR